MTAVDKAGARLRAWRSGTSPDVRAVTRQCLEDACTVFDVTRALIAFEESEEPWLTLAALHEGQFAWREESSESYSPLVASNLDETAFYRCADGRVQMPGAARPTSEPDAIHARIIDEIGAPGLLAIPLRGESFSGRLLVPTALPESTDEWVCADAVGRLVSVSMEAAAAIRDGVRDAIAAERVRVGRDLHDGILQSFTGVVLQLETIHSLMESQPDEAQRLITQAQGMIMGDQRELRTFVETLRPRARPQMTFDLSAALGEMSRRFEEQWNLKVIVAIDRLDPLLVESLGQETYRLILEAVTNSAKHGAATVVHVRLHATGGRMSIEVRDDGSGFAFHGRMTLAEIRSTGHGPSTLAERVASLNGDLTVSSSEEGTSVEISIPLGFEGGAVGGNE